MKKYQTLKTNLFKNFHVNKKINLEIGDDIIVQVIKEPFSSKGARVTTNISIPGSLIVYIPNFMNIMSSWIYNLKLLIYVF